MSTLDNLIKARDEVHHVLETETMSAEQRERLEAIQELTYDGNLTLTDAQKALLAADQKGNPRGGTIMGAYVLTD